MSEVEKKTIRAPEKDMYVISRGVTWGHAMRTFFQVWCCCLNREKRAFDVRVVVLVVCLLGDRAQSAHLHDRRIEDEEVNASELAQSLVQEAFVLGEGGDVCLDDDGLPSALCVDCVGNALRGGGAGNVVDHDVCTIGGEAGCDSGSDGARRASDDSNFACERERHGSGRLVGLVVVQKSMESSSHLGEVRPDSSLYRSTLATPTAADESDR